MEEVLLAFDTEETDVYEKVGEPDTFIVKMTESEAGLLRDEINQQLQE